MAVHTALLTSLGAFATAPALGADLPVPCTTGTCGSTGPSSWVTAGSASAVSAGTTLRVDQQSDRAVLNWQSFNISADGTVDFHQPSATSVALNRIFQGDPVKILGTLQANGSVYLINQNGILFGQGARVNVGGLIASTLDVTPEAVNGLLDAAQQQAPAFRAFVDAQGQVLSKDLVVEVGAKLTAAGGQLALLGTNVTNAGELSAGGGQVILAAGDSIYLAPSTDPNLRGLLVEVGHGGTLTNASTGVVSADRGNVTLVGLMLNQEGRVSATTSVRENGSIRLLARDGGRILANGEPLASNGGALRLGPGSVTSVALESLDDDKAVDATAQTRSFVELEGRTVSLESNSRITVPAGIVEVTARATPVDVSAFPAEPADGRIAIAADAKIDVSGARIERSVASNVLRVELRGSQVADSPEQRAGPLRGEAVFVDIRRSGTRADGTAWSGSPIGDLAGDIATIQKTVEARSLLGGEIHLAATGGVVLARGSTLDVSGGAIDFIGGLVDTTQLLGADGKVYDIADADRDRPYVGPVDAFQVEHKKWGVTESFVTFWPTQGGRYEPGYVEGKDAGSVSITAPRLALDGSILGRATPGINQRQAPGDVPSGALYRPVNQQPLGGRLTLGNALSTGTGGYVVPAARIGSGFVLDTLSRFNPLLDPLPDELATARVRPDLFGAQGLGNLTIYSNGAVTVEPATRLSMSGFGRLSITAASIDVQGSISAPSGSVSLTALPTVTVLPGSGSQIALGAAASIDVAGRWINDAPIPSAPAEHDALAMNGGSVALNAKEGTAIDLAVGSLVDASAGAHRFADGTIGLGRGGTIAIGAEPLVGRPAIVNLGAQLRAHSFARGGQLTLNLNQLCLADTDCAAGVDGTTWIDLATFTQGGFAEITLRSNLGGIEVLSGTLLEPRQVNYAWARDVSRAPSGTPLAALTSLGVLPDEFRLPVDLTLIANPQHSGGGLTDAANFDALGVLRVGHGATLDMDVGARLTLRSSSSIVVDGTLRAPAGSIALNVTTDLPLQGFVPNQGLWLDDGARLDVRGVVQALRDDLGLLRGAVLPGGSITLQAERGYVSTAPRSVLDVSGTAADLVLGQTPVGTAAQPERVASSGGIIDIAAAEGLFLNGMLAAAPGDGPFAGGGALRITLDGNLHGPEPIVSSSIFPYAPRQLRLTSGQGPVIVDPGQSLPLGLYGMGVVQLDRIASGGFVSIDLGAANLFDSLNPAGASVPVSTGSIYFDGSLTLAASASLRLNAPRLVSAPGSTVTLAASYLGLGYDDTKQNSQTGGDGSPGTSVLAAQANLIDFIGTLGLDGFRQSSFRSSTDIRLRGVQALSGTGIQSVAGALLSKGSLDLTAQQIYTTTLSDFEVRLDGPEHTILSVLTNPGQAGTVLSAGSQMTMIADEIRQAGVLRAPFGEITLQAGQLTLADGSITSTSGAGALVPFGTVQVGSDWTYQLPLGQTALFTDTGPPRQRIRLEANDLVAAAGAAIDLRGGGDLLGYEFVPGVTGTKDVLDPRFAPGQFAIVPSLPLKYAPIDPAAQVGFDGHPGDSVYVSGYGSLPAGEYAILPARYALLPGAYLVRPVSGYTDLGADDKVARLDGSVVVSGYRAQAGTGIRDPRNSGFAVLSREQVAQYALYDLSTANDFFTARAEAGDTPASRLPRDSGQLQLLAAASLNLQAALRTTPAASGRGSLVDVAATRLRVANDGAAVDPTSVVIQASQLNALGAESLLLGGLRTETQAGTHIETNTAQLTVASGVALDAPSLTLVARDQLAVESGASLSASGSISADSRSIALTGAGAMLRVSTGRQADVVRSNVTGPGGDLLIGSAARIASRGSALLEATGAVDARPIYDLAGGSLAFSVSKLALGEVAPGYPGLALSSAALSSLGLAELSLASTTELEFFGTTSLQIDGRVMVTAPTLRAGVGAGATIAGRSVLLSGSLTAGAAPLPGDGALTLVADDVLFGGGQLAASGLRALTISAANGFAATAAGALTTAGAVRIETPLVKTGNGVDFTLTAAGPIDIVGGNRVATSSAALPAGVGGSLTLRGGEITLGTKLDFPAGLVSLEASASDPASIAIANGGAIDVAGFHRTFDGQVASGSGGLVRLTSALGGVAVTAGASIDFSEGTGQGDAGVLDIRAPSGVVLLDGTLRGGSTHGRGGEIALDAYTLPDFDSVNRLLNGAGITGARVFHQRGAGDLAVGAAPDSWVRASRVEITSDGGSVVVLGGIDASGAAGGSIRLAARNDIDVYGFLNANATADGAEGGSVDLWSDGGIYARNGSHVSVAGGAGGLGGVVSVRASRDSLATLTDADATNDRVTLGAAVTGNRELAVEGNQRYTVATGTIDATYAAASASNSLFADASSFMQSAGLLESLLGNASATTNVLAGIELQSPGDLTLATDWNLAAWRFDGRPGVLTLRAGGNLAINRSLSDGFAAITGAGAFEVPDVPSRSWSYRLVAGADLNSSNALGVQAAGDLVVAGGTPSTGTRVPVPIMVRTGSGNIDIATAGDFVLSNRASVIYTAGTNSGVGVALPLLGTALRKYSDGGGDIHLDVGGDIVGAPSNQLVTGWLWRAGRRQGLFSPSATGWNVNFQRFEQGIGALAGGDVTVRARGGIHDLSVSIASIGRQTGGTSADSSVVQEIGGGRLFVEGVGDITGGSYYVGKGEMNIHSWGEIGSDIRPTAQSALAPTLTVGNTVVDITARGGLALETVVNPFLLPQSRLQVGAAAISYFSTYSDRSALRATSVGGDLRFINDPFRSGGLSTALDTSIDLNRGASGFQVFPGTLKAVALAGDLSIDGVLGLWPSGLADVEILANGNLELAHGLSVADRDPATLPSVAAPDGSLAALDAVLSSPPPGIAHVPIHSAAVRPDGQDDPNPVRIVAGGDILSANLAYIAKPLRLIAGGDIVDLSATIQNLNDASVSLISAGGSILYPRPRDALFGTILPNNAGIQVDGPGLLVMQAGGDIDLGTSEGVSSTGNLVNPALATNGADLTFLAGATPAAMHLDAFEQRYLVEGAQYDGVLSAFVAAHAGPAGVPKSEALAALRLMPADARYELAQAILFAELRTGGRSAAAAGPTHGDYSRAFTAIETLFPESTVAEDSTTPNPYRGDISLFFSRVYTLDGGSVSLAAPGGEINVGLATPPAAFGVTKPASKLGVVAQRTGSIDALSYRDFQVNESRVFAADGGNILVWSTQGDIDAGRGAKTAIAAPAPTITFDASGNIQTVFPAALTGSGIQALSTSEGTRAGAVDLFAPRGVVNAGDAGIVAGDLTIGATAVLGADNISVSGVSVGVPVDTGGFGAALTGASSVAAGATNAADDTVAQSRQEQTSSTPLADQALGFLDVFVTGFGEACDPAKQDCRNANQ